MGAAEEEAILTGRCCIMMKAEPVPGLTRNTHNYVAQGGNELVIGGKLTFLPGAIIEGGDDLFGQPPSFEPIGYVAYSEATTIAALKDDFNALLAALRSCGLMVTGK